MIERFRRFLEKPTPIDQEFGRAIIDNNFTDIAQAIGKLPSLGEDVQPYYYGLKGHLYSLAEKVNQDPLNHSIAFRNKNNVIEIGHYTDSSYDLPEGYQASFYLIHTPVTDFSYEYECSILGRSLINKKKTRGVSFRFHQSNEDQITLRVESFERRLPPPRWQKALDSIHDLHTHLGSS